MAFGSPSGFATVPNGLCLIIVHKPQRSIISFMASEFSASPQFSASSGNSSPFSTTTAKILLFSPLTTAFTLPPTGEVNLIRSSFLSQKSASPTLTASPSATSNLGVSPTNSVGFTAYSAMSRLSTTRFSAAPPMGRSRPFRMTIVSGIRFSNGGAKLAKFFRFSTKILSKNQPEIKV